MLQKHQLLTGKMLKITYVVVNSKGKICREQDKILKKQHF
jgi:hypothetical protein